MKDVLGSSDAWPRPGIIHLFKKVFFVRNKLYYKDSMYNKDSLCNWIKLFGSKEVENLHLEFFKIKCFIYSYWYFLLEAGL